MPRKLINLKITEVASVDRGAGEGVRVLLTKRWDSMAKTRRTNNDTSGGPGSDDMEDGTDNAAVKALGAFFSERLIKARAAFTKSMRAIVGGDTDKGDLIDKSVDQLIDHVAGVSEDVVKALAEGDSVDDSEDTMNLAAMKKVLGLADSATEADVIAAVTKLAGEETRKKDDEIARLARDLAVAKLSPIEREHYDKLKGDDQAAFLKASSDDRKAIMLKTAPPPLPAEVTKALADLEMLKAENAKLVKAAALVEFTKKAVAAGLPESEGETLMKAYAGGGGEAVDKLLGFLKAATAAAKESGLFKEFGATGRGDGPMTAYEELMAKAVELRKANPALNADQAFAKVFNDPANAELAKRERMENRPRVVA